MAMDPDINLGKGVVGNGSPDEDLTNNELRSLVEAVLATIRPGSRVLAIVPDKTRDDNTHILFPAAAIYLATKGIAKVDVLIAQGTHSPMSSSEKLAKIGAEYLLGALGEIHDHRGRR